MKSLGTLIRLHRLKVDEKRRELNELYAAKDHLEARLAALEAEIRQEQQGADENIIGYAYAGYVRAALSRRAEAMAALQRAEAAIAGKQAELTAAFHDLKKYEVAEARRLELEGEEAARQDRIASDEIALNIYRQRNS